MNSHDKHIIHSSSNCRWGTPSTMFNALNDEFNFVLDVAAESNSAKCALYFGPDHEQAYWRDGLAADWHAVVMDFVSSFEYGFVGQPAVFMNPPYSRKAYRDSVKAGAPNRAMLIQEWAKKASEEAAKGLVVVGVMPASTQTKWWQDYIQAGPHRAVEIRKIPHRVTFDAPDDYEGESGNSGGNTAVIVWRKNPGYLEPWVPAERYWDYE